MNLDYRAARGSNTGDDYHELWALRQSLALLQKDTPLVAVTVEGLKAEDETGKSENWDGVDCAYYYGGETVPTAEKIVIDQVKYSAADPQKKWTIARLTQSDAQSKNNSIIRKLANAFKEIKKNNPDLIQKGNLQIRLVSNQPIDPKVLKAFSRDKSASVADVKKLIDGSGLSNKAFIEFSRSLDFSFCGGESRFALAERVMNTISNWTEYDARTDVNDLLSFIRKKMLPESKGEFITRHSILAQLGVADPAALFPCQPSIKKVDRLVGRKVSQELAKDLIKGINRVCLHGEGGCGKTTALQEIEKLLPEGSAMLVYDCYGAGRYLDSDAYRHKTNDAFLQLSNELAELFQTPLLISPSSDRNYPKLFKRRLQRAAEVVAAINDKALLVIAIDAADNSVAAAEKDPSREPSFVHEFFSIGGLPENVRFLVTARTGRLESLNLPDSFKKIEITGFSQKETENYVKTVWAAAPAAWIEDFHYLSGGNPRVQDYALAFAGSDHENALEYLRPNGKGLPIIFNERLDDAKRKSGIDREIKFICSGLIAFPRPIPIKHLSEVIQISEAQLRDFCADLAPGIRVVDNAIGFADEDFEHFIRQEAQAHLEEVKKQTAKYLLGIHKSDSYAATHIADALKDANLGQELISLINTEKVPNAIKDPVLKREVQLRRLKLAMNVCQETGNTADAMLILLNGADAVKTDSAIRKMLTENPDLAASFARETSSRVILRSPHEVENHGPLLFHMMAHDARRKEGISVREGRRQLRAWLLRRKEVSDEDKKRNPGYPEQMWEISDYDIAAETEANLRMLGAKEAVRQLRRWNPKHVALQVASILSYKLMASGDTKLLERCLKEIGSDWLWGLHVLIPLAVVDIQGEDIANLELCLKNNGNKSLNLKNLQSIDHRHEDHHYNAIDAVLTACEIVINHQGNNDIVIPILKKLSSKRYRDIKSLQTYKTDLIDVSLRAYTLLERLSGRVPALPGFLNEPKKKRQDKSQINDRRESERNSEIKTLVGQFFELYDTRARILLGQIDAPDLTETLDKAISRTFQDDYRLRYELSFPKLRKRAALSLSRLMVSSVVNRRELMEAAFKLANTTPFNAAESEIFLRFAADGALHDEILKGVTERVEKIKSARISADEKIDALVRFARLMLPISPSDAEAFFDYAFAVADETNYDDIHALAVFAPLSKNAGSAMVADEARKAAANYAVVVSDAKVRLDGYDNFPYERIAQALANLDVGVALAAVARWEDSSLIGRGHLLERVLETAHSNKNLSLLQLAAMLPLLKFPDKRFITYISDQLNELSDAERFAVLEELAREEVLRFEIDDKLEVADRLNSHYKGLDNQYWLAYLNQRISFLRSQKNNSSKTEGSPVNLEDYQKKKKKFLEKVNWKDHNFTDAEEIRETVKTLIEGAESQNIHLWASQILEEISLHIPLANRVGYLNALTEGQFDNISKTDIAATISELAKKWQDSPAVQKWNRDYLLNLVAEELPTFTRDLYYDYTSLPDLLEKSGAANDKICQMLITATAKHVDSFSAPSVYAMVGLIGRYCRPEDAAVVINKYLIQLVERIPEADRDEWDVSDIPTDPRTAFARYIYALLSDIDVRNRWRSAHSIRSLARLGDASTIDEIIKFYNTKTEKSYRKPDTPFYWIASRLWLVIAIARIANENPSAVKHLTGWLFEIATDGEFPHVILRAFAKSALSSLLKNEEIKLSAVQQGIFEQINTSPYPRQKNADSQREHFDKYQYKEKEERRFRFDSLDTLPYWYAGKQRLFADLGFEEFLDVAEHWIVDKWGVTDNPWMWSQEKRKERFSESPLNRLDRNDHGSLPVAERFDTHLEWHAMWCAIGDLLQRKPLAEKNDYDDDFEERLKSNELSYPPFWLADFRGPKPLHLRFWFVPKGDIEEWVESVEDRDFFEVLGLADKGQTLVVGSDFDSRASEFTLSVSIDTALVSPETASALLRSLQTIDDPWDYCLPSYGSEHEIDSPPYKLTGWLTHPHSNSGLDERDPFKNDIAGIRCVPSEDVMQELNLRFAFDHQPKWISVESGEDAFRYQAWSDVQWDDYRERPYYGSDVRSNGWHLLIGKNQLKNYLNKKGLDLIVEVRIVRKNKAYDYSEYNTKETKEAEFERIFILRRDGTVETAEGRFSTW
jgi:NACHT domain.